MSLNNTPSGERIHISFFGRRNVGKSSVVNAVTGQKLAVVSDTLGTTTDPVSKAMELLPIGPVMIYDTPGYDDEGTLGNLRVEKTKEVLGHTDIAILVLDGSLKEPMTTQDREYIEQFQEKKIPYIIVYNKKDVALKAFGGRDNEIAVSALTGEHIFELKEKIAHMTKHGEEKCLVADLVKKNELVVLVIPIDASAPKGRLILPQQQVIRELLEVGAWTLCCKDTELSDVVERYGRQISLVITDSQAFEQVANIVPEEIELTSFSILMARYKGFLKTALAGVRAIPDLKEGANILIAEGCTHHRQCEDIGTVKIPNWLQRHEGKKFNFSTCSGREFPMDLTKYDLVIHCGGCTLNAREIESRMERANEQKVPFCNYGTTIAWLKGIIERSVHVIPD